MKHLIFTIILTLFLCSFANNPVQSFFPGCIQFINESDASIEMTAEIKHRHKFPIPDDTVLEAKFGLKPNTSVEKCYQTQGHAPTDLNYVSQLDINEVKKTFAAETTSFENAGWAQIFVISGDDPNQLTIKIIGYKEDGSKLISKIFFIHKKEKAIYKK